MLAVVPVRCQDRTGKPSGITLELRRDGRPFGQVGERRGVRLTRLASRLAQARSDPEQAAIWPDPDDRFPDADDADGPGSAAGFPPAEREYFTLRSGELTDPPGGGELRCTLRSSAQWLGEPDTGGQRCVAGWRLNRRAIVEAWGAGGIGVRAVLTSAELTTLLDTVLSEPETGARAEPGPGRAKRAGRLLGGISAPPWRQRGRTPDGNARSRLPALRTQARSVAVAGGDAAARRGDVRR